MGGMQQQHASQSSSGTCTVASLRAALLEGGLLGAAAGGLQEACEEEASYEAGSSSGSGSSLASLLNASAHCPFDSPGSLDLHPQSLLAAGAFDSGMAPGVLRAIATASAGSSMGVAAAGAAAGGGAFLPDMFGSIMESIKRNLGRGVKLVVGGGSGSGSAALRVEIVHPDKTSGARAGGDEEEEEEEEGEEEEESKAGEEEEEQCQGEGPADGAAPLAADAWAAALQHAAHPLPPGSASDAMLYSLHVFQGEQGAGWVSSAWMANFASPPSAAQEARVRSQPLPPTLFHPELLLRSLQHVGRGSLPQLLHSCTIFCLAAGQQCHVQSVPLSQSLRVVLLGQQAGAAEPLEAAAAAVAAAAQLVAPAALQGLARQDWLQGARAGVLRQLQPCQGAGSDSASAEARACAPPPPRLPPHQLAQPLPPLSLGGAQFGPVFSALGLHALLPALAFPSSGCSDEAAAPLFTLPSGDALAQQQQQQQQPAAVAIVTRGGCSFVQKARAAQAAGARALLVLDLGPEVQAAADAAAAAAAGNSSGFAFVMADDGSGSGSGGLEAIAIPAAIAGGADAAALWAWLGVVEGGAGLAPPVGACAATCAASLQGAQLALLTGEHGAPPDGGPPAASASSGATAPSMQSAIVTALRYALQLHADGMAAGDEETHRRLAAWPTWADAFLLPGELAVG